MKTLDRMVQFLRVRKVISYGELSDGVLATLGILSFLSASYWGLMLGDVVPGFVSDVNELGVSWPAVGWALVLGGFGVSVWFFGCIAARCHSILYDRWFK